MNLPNAQSTAAALVGGALLLSASFATAQIQTYDVNVAPGQYTLYTDPSNGNSIQLGGFSGLYPVPGQPNSFYTITDRGPATDFVLATATSTNTYKVFVQPKFGPHIVTLRLLPNGTVKVDDVKPLKKPNGGQISGLPSKVPATDIPFDFSLAQLSFDEDSLDAEGITIDPWGNFWICDEYKPSVAMVAPNGKVQMRLVPAGTVTGLEEVPTYGVLPAVLSKRRNNRGFEGIAADANGMLYAVVQRPLSNPNRGAGDANGNARIVAINLNTLLNGSPQPLVQQFLYRIPTVPNNVTLSDLFSIGNGRLLVSERATDTIFIADLAGATDLTPLELPNGRLVADPTKTLEQLNTAQLATFGITPITKTPYFTGMTGIDPVLEKVEGICISGNHLVLTYDNDFNVGEFASPVANPVPNGPVAQLELLGNFYPKLFYIPLP